MYQDPVKTDNALKLPLEQDAWMLHRFGNHEVIRIHLSPGQSIEKHRNDWRILFYVLAGAGRLEVEGRSFELGEGQSVAVKPGSERSWKNTGESSLELLVIKTREEK